MEEHNRHFLLLHNWWVIIFRKKFVWLAQLGHLKNAETQFHHLPEECCTGLRNVRSLMTIDKRAPSWLSKPQTPSHATTYVLLLLRFIDANQALVWSLEVIIC